MLLISYILMLKIKNGDAGLFEGITSTISGVFQVIVGIFKLNSETLKNGVQNEKRNDISN